MHGEQKIANASRRASDPTFPPPNADDLSSVLNRNIQSIQDRRNKEEKRCECAGAHRRRYHSFLPVAWPSCTFICRLRTVDRLQCRWIAAIKPWDPTFVILATEASIVRYCSFHLRFHSSLIARRDYLSSG